MARRVDDLSRAVRSLADELRGRRDPSWQRVPLPATVSGRYLALGIVGLYLELVVPEDFRVAVFALVAASAVIAALVGIERNRPARIRPWYTFVAGAGLLAVAQIWTSSSFASSSAAGGWLGLALDIAAFALLIAGLGALAIGRGGSLDRASITDTLILATAAAFIVWVLLAPQLAVSQVDAWAVAVLAANPLLDIVLLSIALRFTLTGGAESRSLRMLVAGIAAMLAGDLLRASTGDVAGLQHFADSAWGLGFVLWGAAALHPSMAGLIERRDLSEVPLSPLRLGMLAITALIPPLVLLALVVRGDTANALPVAIGSALLFVLAMIRLADVLTRFRALASRQRDTERRLVEVALFDPLTGLPNRLQFQTSLESTLAEGGDLALLLLDLDDFKTVNDTLGQPAGDVLLRTASERLAAALRPSDLVARVGDDEFAVLLPGASGRAAESVAARVVNGLRQEVSVVGHDVPVLGSVGISAAREAEPITPEELVRRAEVALSEAKGHARGSWVAYRADLEAPRIARLEVRSALGQAIQRGDFSVLWQPIWSLADGRYVAVEALARWRHPIRGVIAPVDFLAAAEESGLIVPIGHQILDLAARQARSWENRGEPWAVPVHVNISARQLASRVLVGDVQEAIRRTGMRADQLVLEIAEDALLAPGSAQTLGQLRSLGLRLALDEFGTQVGSLRALAGMPFDLVKLGRPLIAQATATGAARVVLDGLVAMAADLGLQIIAEGVETEAQRTALIDIGCTFGQGFLVAHPVDAGTLDRALLRSVRDGAAGMLWTRTERTDDDDEDDEIIELAGPIPEPAAQPAPGPVSGAGADSAAGGIANATRAL